MKDFLLSPILKVNTYIHVHYFILVLHYNPEGDSMKIQITVSTQNFNVYRKIILTSYYTVHIVHFLLLLFLYILLLRYLNGILHHLFIFLNAGWLQLTFTLKNQNACRVGVWFDY